jgi:signal peptidase
MELIMIKNPKIKKVLTVSLSVLLSILIVLIFIFTIYAFNSRKNGGIPQFFGKSYLTVVSDSMNTENEEYDFKGFKRGDMVIIQRYTWVEASDLRFEVGDIITFSDTDEEGNAIYNTHRIVKVNSDHYITQGDVATKAGLSQDPADGFAERVYFMDVVGSYQKTIKGVGNIFLFFQSTVGFLLVIVLPLLTLFVLEIFNFRKAYIEYKEEKHPKSSPEELQKEIERLQKQLESQANKE